MSIPYSKIGGGGVERSTDSRSLVPALHIDRITFHFHPHTRYFTKEVTVRRTVEHLEPLVGPRVYDAIQFEREEGSFDDVRYVAIPTAPLHALSLSVLVCGGVCELERVRMRQRSIAMARQLAEALGRVPQESCASSASVAGHSFEPTPATACHLNGATVMQRYVMGDDAAPDIHTMEAFLTSGQRPRKLYNYPTCSAGTFVTMGDTGVHVVIMLDSGTLMPSSSTIPV